MSQMKSTTYLSNFCFRGSQKLPEPPQPMLGAALKCYGISTDGWIYQTFIFLGDIPNTLQRPWKQVSCWSGFSSSPSFLRSPFIHNNYIMVLVFDSAFRRAHMNTSDNMNGPRNPTLSMRSRKHSSKDPIAGNKSGSDNQYRRTLHVLWL